MKAPRWTKVLLLAGAAVAVGMPAAGAPIDIALPSAAFESALADPAGKWIALGATDGSVFLLNAADGAVVNQWQANGANQIERLAFSADGAELLTVSPNRTIRVLDTLSPQVERAHWTLPEYYPGADLTPDGKHALVVTHDGPIRWFDVATRNAVSEWRDSTQPHGYSYARLLNNDGLAVIAPISGDGALVDAAGGRVLARLEIRGRTPVRMSHVPDDVTLRTEGNVLAWKREELLAAARVANPTATVRGWAVPFGGPVGHAALVSAPSANWIFWGKNVSPFGFAWAEPSWDAHPFFGFARPMIVDWSRRRLWFATSKGHFQGWSWDELGRPDALAIALYLKPPERIGNTLVAVGGPNSYRMMVDWREMAPVYAGDDSRFATPNAGPEKTFEAEVVSDAGVVGSWRGELDPLKGWMMTWHGANQNFTAAAAVGFRGTRPAISVSPRGLTAVYSSTPGVIILGQTNAQPTAFGGGGVKVSVPALQLFEPGTARPFGAFDDHRAVGVIDVRWSGNGRWIATRDYDGSGNGAGALRVFTVPEGRRAGPAHPTKLMGDFAVGDDGTLVWSDGDGIVQLSRPGSPLETIVPPTTWARSARIALSPSGQQIAMLTGGDEVVVLQVADRKEVRRWKLPGGRSLGWEEPQGGLVFVSPTTIVVAHGHSGLLRKLEL